MSEMVIRTDQFPASKALPDRPVPGDEIEIVVRGRIRVVSDELVDITGLGDPPRFTLGYRTISVAITGLDLTLEDKLIAAENTE